MVVKKELIEVFLFAMQCVNAVFCIRKVSNNNQREYNFQLAIYSKEDANNENSNRASN